MSTRLIITASLVVLLSACAHPRTAESTGDVMPVAPLVGGDHDAHGCIPSAGYSWCARTAQCERPWELAERAGFTLDADRFAAFCAQAGP